MWKKKFVLKAPTRINRIKKQIKMIIELESKGNVYFGWIFTFVLSFFVWQLENRTKFKPQMQCAAQAETQKRRNHPEDQLLNRSGKP